MKMVSSTYTLPHPCAIKYFEICFQIVRLVRTPYYVASVKNKSVVLSAPFNTFYYTIIRSTESSIFPQSQSIKCEKSVDSIWAYSTACVPFTYGTKKISGHLYFQQHIYEVYLHLLSVIYRTKRDSEIFWYTQQIINSNTQYPSYF